MFGRIVWFEGRVKYFFGSSARFQPIEDISFVDIWTGTHLGVLELADDFCPVSPTESQHRDSCELYVALNKVLRQAQGCVAHILPFLISTP